MLPQNVIPILKEQLDRVKMIHDKDLKNGFGKVYLPYAIERKYINAASEWKWQYVFPSKTLSKDPRSNIIRRHHIHLDSINKEIRKAALVVRFRFPFDFIYYGGSICLPIPSFLLSFFQ